MRTFAIAYLGVCALVIATWPHGYLWRSVGFPIFIGFAEVHYLDEHCKGIYINFNREATTSPMFDPTIGEYSVYGTCFPI